MDVHKDVRYLKVELLKDRVKQLEKAFPGGDAPPPPPKRKTNKNLVAGIPKLAVRLNLAGLM